MCLTAGIPTRLLTTQAPPRSASIKGATSAPAIETGELFTQLLKLTGSNTDDGTHRRSDQDSRWEGLSHYLLGAGSLAGDDHSSPVHMQGIVPGHAYALLGAFDLNEEGGSRTDDPSLQLIQLRNPWGQVSIALSNLTTG